jgi:ketosteroid isomerase-like protein
MDTLSIANRLVELCRNTEYRKAQDELYAGDAVSVEPEGSPWWNAEGIEALNEKVAKWHEMVKEVHRSGVSDPVVAGPFFSVSMVFDLTFQDGNRNLAEEIALYEVRDGKIVREQFFYTF